MKNAYLTIDDSPSERMGDLIQILQHLQIPAIFFCIGKNLERYPHFAIQAIQNGFVLGNHSWSHPHFSKISIEKAFLEIQQTDELLDDIYQQAGIQRVHKWFRFPYGDKGDGRKGLVFEPIKKKNRIRHQMIQTLLRGLGYTCPAFPGITYQFYQKNLAKDVDWHWTFDIMEWSLAQRKPTFNIGNLPQVINRITSVNPPDCRGYLSETPRWLESPSDEIILLHDHTETANYLPTILQSLLTQGLAFPASVSIPLPKKL